MTVRPAPSFKNVALIGALICLMLDQSLKAWAVQEFPPGEFREVIPGLLSLGLIYNTGAAWSMFSGAAFPLAILRLIAGMAILVYLRRPGLTRGVAIALTLVAGGALSNALDGLKLGKVVDTLSAHPLSLITRALGQGEFPIFNLADVWVVSGVLLLLVSQSFRKGSDVR